MSKPIDKIKTIGITTLVKESKIGKKRVLIQRLQGEEGKHDVNYKA